MQIGDFYLNLQPLNVLILDTDPLPSPLAALINLSILLQSAIEFHAPADGWGAWALIVVIACACLMISAFVSGSEIAYFGLTPAEIDELRDDGDNPRSRKAFSMVSRPERLLATILISNNLVNITMVVLMTFAISKTVQFNNAVVNFLVQTVFLTFLLLLFGEIFPKLVARGRGVRHHDTAHRRDGHRIARRLGRGAEDNHIYRVFAYPGLRYVAGFYRRHTLQQGSAALHRIAP